MQISRRQVITIAAVAGSFLAFALPSQAQPKYPTKPIRILIATTPGSQPDMLARVIGQKMSETWGQAVVVENRAGGGGAIAATTVAKATPDGHTLFYVLPNFAITAALQSNVPYDPFKDFAPISHIGITTNVLVASPALGVKSVKDLIALAKTQPGKLIFASSATGSAAHLTGARFNFISGLKVIHVAFKGGPEAMLEVLAGRSHYHIGTMGVVLQYIKEGRLTALAVTTPQRAPVLPDVPALGETLREFTRPDTSHGMLAPAGTPRPIVNQVNKELARILDLPDVKERMQGIAYVPAPSTPEDYTKTLHGQIEALSRLAREAGLKAN